MHAAFSPEQWAALRNDTDPSPVQMLNLIQFADSAQYPEGSAHSGEEGFSEYMARARPFLKKVGGEIVWCAEPQALLTGEPDLQWDIAFVIAYPMLSAFVAMVEDPSYATTVMPYRSGSVANHRLIKMKPRHC